MVGRGQPAAVRTAAANIDGIEMAATVSCNGHWLCDVA